MASSGKIAEVEMLDTVTPLVRLTEIEDQYNVGRVFIKDESVNPNGTIKDRRSAVVLREANKYKVDKLVLITSGNNGYSLAQHAIASPVKVICVVNRRIHPSIKRNLETVAYQVIEHNLDHKILRPEEIVAFAREREEEVIWDVTNGYEDAYDSVVEEILRSSTPSHVVVPVGSGGIYMGFLQAVERRKQSAKVIGIGSRSSSVSIADKLTTPWTPYAKALDYNHGRGHTIYRISEEAVKRAHYRYQNVVPCEPSSSVVFSVFEQHNFGPQDTVVLINTGKSPVN